MTKRQLFTFVIWMELIINSLDKGSSNKEKMLTWLKANRGYYFYEGIVILDYY